MLTISYYSKVNFPWEISLNQYTTYFSSFAYTPQFSQTAVNCCQFAQKTGREGEKVSEVALVRR